MANEGTFSSFASMMQPGRIRYCGEYMQERQGSSNNIWQHTEKIGILVSQCRPRAQLSRVCVGCPSALNESTWGSRIYILLKACLACTRKSPLKSQLSHRSRNLPSCPSPGQQHFHPAIPWERYGAVTMIKGFLEMRLPGKSYYIVIHRHHTSD